MPQSEKCCTALARMAAAAGDADEALAVAQRMQAAPTAPKRLRLFHPALVAYTVAGNVAAAFKVGGLSCSASAAIFTQLGQQQCANNLSAESREQMISNTQPAGTSFAIEHFWIQWSRVNMRQKFPSRCGAL